MQKGVCQLSLLPIRSKPESSSEMVSQLLFGETYEVLEFNEDWVQIRTSNENYPGWISRNQFSIWDEKEVDLFILNAFPFITAVNQLSNLPMYLLPGSVLHKLELLNDKYVFTLNLVKYEIPMISEGLRTLNIEELGQFATKFLNAPYLWGGKTMWGIDCSGFTQLIYKAAGIQLPRDAYQQAEIGITVDFVNEAKIGDLVFFDNEEGKITHVGLMLTPGEIIHSSGMVRMDLLDSYGIFNEKIGKHTHKLKLIKRIFGF